MSWFCSFLCSMFVLHFAEIFCIFLYSKRIRQLFFMLMISAFYCFLLLFIFSSKNCEFKSFCVFNSAWCELDGIFRVFVSVLMRQYFTRTFNVGNLMSLTTIVKRVIGNEKWMKFWIFFVDVVEEVDAWIFQSQRLSLNYSKNYFVRKINSKNPPKYLKPPLKKDSILMRHKL